MNNFLEVAVDAAREAGSILRAEFDRPKKISYKGEVDIVTESDKRSEAIIVSKLRNHFPAARHRRRGGWSRRCGGREILLARRPARRHHELRALLSLLRRFHRPGRRWRARRRRRAESCHQRTFHRHARRRRLSRSQTHPRFADRKTGNESGLHRLSHVTSAPTIETFTTTGNSRCARTAFGAMVLPLSISAPSHAAASMASGNSGLHSWDTAAGMLIVKEAGGMVTDLAGLPYHPGGPSILATNGQIHAEMQQRRRSHRRTRRFGAALSSPFSFAAPLAVC